MTIGLRAIRDYVTRKRPDIAKQLDAAKDTLDFAVILKRVRSRDLEVNALKHSAQYAQQVWAEGEPLDQRLRVDRHGKPEH